IPPLIERVRVKPPPQADPFAATVLDIKQAFLERQATREGLRALMNPAPVKPIVVINGDPLMGKSYTSAYISHVLRSQENVRLCLVELTKGGGKSTGPAELARDIVAQMDGDATTCPPQGATVDDRWIQDLINWIFSQVSRSQAK